MTALQELKKTIEKLEVQLEVERTKNKGGNTSNLMSHLRTSHHMIYSTLQRKKQHFLTTSQLSLFNYWR